MGKTTVSLIFQGNSIGPTKGAVVEVSDGGKEHTEDTEQRLEQWLKHTLLDPSGDTERF